MVKNRGGEMNILILGSNSHIAKGLIHYYKQDKDIKLTSWNRYCKSKDDIIYAKIDSAKPDIIINCIGKSYVFSYDDVSDFNYYDDQIINHLENNKDCLYINMSSRIVSQDIKEDDIKYKYWLNKKYLELKHRLLPDLNIIDVRIPAYFSRWIDLDSGFLMAEILKAIKTKDYSKLYYNEDELLYYITPRYLIKIINDTYKIKGNKAINLIDVIKPISKRDVISHYLPDYKNDLMRKDLKIEINSNIEYEYQEWLKLNKDI